MRLRILHVVGENKYRDKTLKYCRPTLIILDTTTHLFTLLHGSTQKYTSFKISGKHINNHFYGTCTIIPGRTECVGLKKWHPLLQKMTLKKDTSGQKITSIHKDVGRKYQLSPSRNFFCNESSRFPKCNVI